MNYLWAAALACALLGCEASNPRSCADGSCTDPAYPFCDADGQLEGNEKVCIAVDCTPGEFRACRGDAAITCNAAGGDYDLVQCEKGCDDASGGCRLCEPNQTACTNGKVATCDSAGRAAVRETCALGCFEDEPRCREIVPSNGLANLLDTPNPPDLNLGEATIDSTTGTIMTADGPLLVPSTLVDGGTIRVFVANKLTLGDVTLTSSADPRAATGPAVAFLARGPIVVEGRVQVLGAAGGVTSDACRGGVGYLREDHAQVPAYVQSIGSGGGGHATPGGRGGNYGTMSFRGGVGGGTAGAESLVPLRGGCASGGVDFEADIVTLPVGSPGGGALQLTSRVRIDVKGVVDARGAQGTEQTDGREASTFYGGGAGGGILLEAPAIEMHSGSRLIAKGGGGASGGPPTTMLDDTASPTPGTQCLPGGMFFPWGGVYVCGPGGNGATVGTAATDGGDTTTSDYAVTGGGGGGLGRIRVNVANGDYIKSLDVIEAGALTTGEVQTR